jgi:mannose-1-phosphate guanylyltransferase
MTADRIAIAILAGGHGTRLWPLSRPGLPKQFVPILPEGSMLQATYARAGRIVDAGNILVIGNREHRQIYRDQLPEMPEDNLVLEPVGRGTAPCIAFTAELENERERFDVIVTIPADHVVPDPDEWVLAIQLAADHAAAKNELVSIASIPEIPETKFGYLVVGENVGGTDRNPINRVVRFVEKPEQTTLGSMLSRGQCLRNMGMIAFRPAVMLEELEKHLPAVHEEFVKAKTSAFDLRSIDEAYAAIQKASIDESVLHLSSNHVAISSRIRSIDAGDFASIGSALESDDDGNAFKGDTITINAKSNTIISDSTTIAVVGIDDHIVVVDGDTVLVCPKDQSQRIRDAADQ